MASVLANESNSGEFDRVIRTADSDESSTYEQGNILELNVYFNQYFKIS